ncbi:hypothetical protein [Candidatus Solirubrobacter pratensis]|uniref:hypothetical protein n=1 Tax=Candidatus Solirubrobacter pratensis TaxID=1298857 RepID=UPI0012DD855F|nr:hypothetical protein [Candidatus Solirubrobacter pratensis]
MSVDPARLSFTVWRGTTFEKAITYYEDRDEASPHDLTGFTAELILRDKIGGVTLAAMTTENAMIELRAGGIIFLQATPEVTASWTFNAAAYSLTVTSPAGRTDALLHGLFRVRDL